MLRSKQVITLDGSLVDERGSVLYRTHACTNLRIMHELCSSNRELSMIDRLAWLAWYAKYIPIINMLIC